MNICAWMYTHMHVTTIGEKRSHKFKEIKEGCMGGFEERKGKAETM